MAMDPKQLQAALDGPPPAHVRNINVDTHVGQAPNRPYALLEDYMKVNDGYRDLDALNAALANEPAPDSLPKGAPNPNEVVDEGGSLVRYVPSNEARESFVRDGVVRERVRFTRRGVALSMDAARVASQHGTPTDYWNGFTWLRDGFKPEKDFPVMAKTARNGAADELVFDIEASPSAAATIRHEVGRLDAARAPLPVEPTAAPARKEK